jgi:hypothetical protein
MKNMLIANNMSKINLTKKQKKKLLAKGKFRDSFELWVDHHNHKMEMVRTLTGIVGVILSCVIMLKVFSII